jgi:hypothetical protein
VALSADRVTADLLNQLERFLLERRSPPMRSLAAGLDQEDLRSRADELGIDIPDDAVAWWSWHDGSGEEILPGWGHISFEQTLGEYRYRRARALEEASSPASALPDPDRWWHPNWLTVGNLGTASSLIIDASSDDRDSVPIRTVDWSGIGDADYPRLVASSLAALIRGLLRVCDAGRFVYSPERGTWRPADDVWRPLHAIVAESSHGCGG